MLSENIMSSNSPTSHIMKRRATTEPSSPFFTPSSMSFNPLPYFPHSSHSIPRQKNLPVSATGDDHVAPPVDPSPNDPHAIFIHPPFISFPDAQLYPEGLSYNVLAMNPEWFLDSSDFISEDNRSPSRIPYPSFLEPPRGWCPIKKKESRSRSKNTEGWLDGEEPRLRCTFCRRTYAGVNAKSMWRRHVLEKHKIAMSNKRESADRFRHIRSANKENGALPYKSKQLRDFKHYSSSTEFQRRNYEHLARTATLPHYPLLPSSTETVIFSEKEFNQSKEDFQPITPQCSAISCVSSSGPLLSPNNSPAGVARIVQLSSPTTMNHRDIGICMESPYDPTQTPEFRHCQPQLPHNQPWKFPSPSHPLHTTAKELCLGVPVGGMKGEGLQSTYIPSSASPLEISPESITELMATSHPSPLEASPLLGKGRSFRLERRSVSDSNLEPKLMDITKRKLLPRHDEEDLFSISFARETGSESRILFSNSFTSNDSYESAEDPFGTWIDLDGITTTRRDGSSNSSLDNFSYSQSPMLRTIELPSVSRDQTPDNYLNVGTWQHQASGIGLGLRLRFSGEGDYCDGGELAFKMRDDLKEMLSPQKDQGRGEIQYNLESNGPAFPFSVSPLKRRETVDF